MMLLFHPRVHLLMCVSQGQPGLPGIDGQKGERGLQGVPGFPGESVTRPFPSKRSGLCNGIFFQELKALLSVFALKPKVPGWLCISSWRCSFSSV